MLAGLRRRAIRAPRSTRGRGPDAGFTLVEVLVAITLVAIVMTALTTFFVGAVSATSRQSGRQVATQLADDAAERVRSLKGSGLATGRDRASTDAQWGAPVAGVAAYLTDMGKTWDPAAAFPAGATAPLPTTARPVTLNGLTYGQNWYLGTCWQPAGGGDCGTATGAGYVPFFRVVVAVTWSERHCPGGTCSYVTSTLVSSTSGEPVFNPNLNAQAPTVDNPGNQVGEVSLPVNLVLTATGGAAPLTWSALGLPAGLTLTTGGLVSGSPTAAGSYPVTVSVTDGFGLAGTAALTWTVNPAPKLTALADQTTVTGTAVSLPTPVTGGTAPLVWSVAKPGGWGATGLPPGLSLNTSTGAVTGTPTSTGSHPVTITVTDKLGTTDSATFTWSVVQPLAIQSPGPLSYEATATIAPRQIVATGGGVPYTWSATGLPAGLSIDATTGQITGTPTSTGTYRKVTVTVTDAIGGSASTGNLTWTVTAGPTITAPTTAARSNALGASINLPSSAGGGTAPYTWTPTGLPAGLAMNAAGVIAGTLTAAARYVTTVTVTDGVGGTYSVTFAWTVS
jgi:prepilin-type N-terminal cleavage/methylation domain-containing protein